MSTDPELARRLDAIEAVAAIEQLTARYWRLMDTKRWDELREVFADDVVLVAPDDAPGSPPTIGRDHLVAVIRSVLGPAVSVHQGTNPEIELDGRDRAHGTWSMRDDVTYDRHPERSFSGAGHYEMTYVRDQDGWKIATITLRRLRLDPGS